MVQQRQLRLFGLVLSFLDYDLVSRVISGEVPEETARDLVAENRWIYLGYGTLELAGRELLWQEPPGLALKCGRRDLLPRLVPPA